MYQDHQDQPEPPWRSPSTPQEVRAAAEEMFDWFHQNYEDPVENCPYDSAEDGYQFIWGGPYDPQEELSDQFGDTHASEIIDTVAQFLSEQAYEWSGLPGDDDDDDGADEDPDDSTEDPDGSEK